MKNGHRSSYTNESITVAFIRFALVAIMVLAMAIGAVNVMQDTAQDLRDQTTSLNNSETP